MCTLTWLSDPNGSRIFFNRDEKRTRLPARPPEKLVVNGTRILAPIDGNAGGTWLAVNEYGLAVAILNFYEADALLPDDGKPHESRGQLVLKVASCRTLRDALETINTLSTESYRPFILTVFDDKGNAGLIKWDGNNLVLGALGDDEKPITTSSFKTGDVLSSRRVQYEEMTEDHENLSDEILRSFHHSRSEKGGAYSVTMTRDDAQTFGYCEVAVHKDKVSYFYQPREIGHQDPAYLPGVTFEMMRA